MSLKVVLLNSFKRDLKRIKKRGYDISLLDSVVRMMRRKRNLLKDTVTTHLQATI